MKIDHVLFKECERTKAEVCECSTLNTLSEAGEAINAVAELVHSDTVKGTIKFTQESGNPTVITGTITGLTPGEHGFHVRCYSLWFERDIFPNLPKQLYKISHTYKYF